MKTCKKGLHEYAGKRCLVCAALARAGVCRTAYAAAYYAANKEKKRAQGAAWHAANKEQVKIRGALHRAANKETIKVRCAAWCAKNEDKIKLRNAAYRVANKDKIKLTASARYIVNADKIRATHAVYRAENQEKIKLGIAAWKKANRDKGCASAARRKANQLQATPAWANKAKIEEFYYTANMLGMHTGEHYHVDHIVPLKGRLVCGLHCEANLQILTRSENTSKGNRHVI